MPTLSLPAYIGAMNTNCCRTNDKKIWQTFWRNEGVQLIIGAHPHVIQPMELRYDEQGNPCALIVYSLGNFISNMKTRDTVGGAMVKVVIRRDITGKYCYNRHNTHSFIPDDQLYKKKTSG